MPAIPNNPYFESISELAEGREGTPWNMGGSREYMRRFRIITKDKRLNSLAVCSCPLLPARYSIYQSGDGLEFDPLAHLIRYHAAQEHPNDWRPWIVTAYYSTESQAGGPPNAGFPGGPGSVQGPGQGSEMNPWEELPDIDWDWEIQQYAPPTDLTGLSFLNVAGQPYSPPLTFEDPYLTVTASRNEIFFDTEKAVRLSYSVNVSEFLGREPTSVQSMPPKAKLQWKGPLHYYRVTYKLRFANERPLGDNAIIVGEVPPPIGPPRALATWQPRVLQVGLMELKNNPRIPPGGSILTQIKGDDGVHAISHPVPLGVNGKALTRAQILNQELVYRQYEWWRREDFNELYDWLLLII